MRRSRRFGRLLTGSVALAAVLVGAASMSPATAAPAGSATTEAVAAATSSGLRVAVATVDTTTGTATAAGEADALFPSESVVKVLIAARLLVEGGLTGDDAAAAAAMISASDDGVANGLWGEVGGPDVVAWAADRYGVTGLEAPSEWGWWGNTKVSANGMAALYAALAADPLVAPWLTATMAATTAVADDGTDQTFGLGRWLAEGRTAVKQGWGGDDDSQSTANLLSTGYLDGRFAVVVIVQDPDSTDALDLVPDLDPVAAAVVDDLTGAAAAEATAAAEARDDAAQAAAAQAPAAGELPTATALQQVATGAWWPAALTVLLASFVVGAATAVISVATRRRGVARPS